MRLQVASILDAVVLISSGVGAAVALGVRTVRRAPQDAAVVRVSAEG